MISIGLISYNHENNIELRNKCLKGIFNNTNPDEYELTIFIDNKIGCAKSYNRVIQASNPNNDVVLISDDFFIDDKDWLKKFHDVAYSGDNIGYSTIITRDVERRKEDGELINYIFGLNGFCYLKRSTINKVGLFDGDNFPWGYEEDDYCIRMQKVGLIAKAVEVKHTHVGQATINMGYWNRSEKYNDAWLSFRKKHLIKGATGE